MAGSIFDSETGQSRNGKDIDAKTVGIILCVTVAKRNGSRFPAASVVAAQECPISMDELVVWICFPLRRFSTAGNNDAGAIARLTRARLHCCCEMHHEGHWTQNAFGMMNEANQLSRIGFAS